MAKYDRLTASIDRLKHDIRDLGFSDRPVKLVPQHRVVRSGGLTYRQLRMDVVETTTGPAFVAGSLGG